MPFPFLYANRGILSRRSYGEDGSSAAGITMPGPNSEFHCYPTFQLRRQANINNLIVKIFVHPCPCHLIINKNRIHSNQTFCLYPFSFVLSPSPLPRCETIASFAFLLSPCAVRPIPCALGLHYSINPEPLNPLSVKIRVDPCPNFKKIQSHPFLFHSASRFNE